MHELGVTRNIVAIVAEAAQGRRVSRVTLEIGKLSGVLAEAVAFCFDVVTQESAIAGARLEIIEIEGRARCRDCGAEFPTPTLFAGCACGSRRVERLGGEELKIREFACDDEQAPSENGASALA